MIVDELTHLKDYAALHPALEAVAGFLEDHDLLSMPDGRVELDAPGCFVNLQTMAGKTREEAVLESHRVMVDIQIPLTGDEEMGYSPLASLSQVDYDAQRDLAFHGERPGDFFCVRRGMFAIFFPQDAHAPGVCHAGLRKAVFKLPASAETK